MFKVEITFNIISGFMDQLVNPQLLALEMKKARMMIPSP